MSPFEQGIFYTQTLPIIITNLLVGAAIVAAIVMNRTKG